MTLRKLTVLGETFVEGDLTPAEFEQLEEATGFVWSYAFEAMSNRAKALRHGAAALLQQRLGISEQDALAKVDGLTMVELNAGLVEYDDMPQEYVDGFPLEADEE